METMWSVATSVTQRVSQWALEYADDDQQQEEATEEENGQVEQPLKFQLEQSMEEFYFKTKDGISIKTRVIRGKLGPEQGGKVMLLASPLGFSDMYVFRPFIAQFGTDFTYVNWNYRGLFDSEEPKRLRQISIRDQAETALEVLHAAGFKCADVMVGHSMGVQVALEYTLLYPSCVDSLILVNGGYGNVFHTCFQPMVRLPLVGNISEWIIRTMLRNNPKKIVEITKTILTLKPIDKTLTMAGRLIGPKMMKDINGDWFINEWINTYFGGLVADDKSAANYCRLFQELNAHNVYHLLHTIEHPTLLVSGAFDYLTPSYLMSEMASEMKNATHQNDFWSTHITLMEAPERVMVWSEEFLRKNKRMKRVSSVCFSSHDVQLSAVDPSES